LGKLRFIVGVLGFVVEVEVVGWLRFWLEGCAILSWVSDLRNWWRVCYLWSWGRVCYLWRWWRLRVIERGVMVGLIIRQRLGLAGLISLCWKRWMIGWGILVVVGACCMVWLTSLGADFCEGFAESRSIFLFDSRKWGSLWCGGRFHYHDTCSTEVWPCMSLSRNRGHSSLGHLFGCAHWIFDRRSTDFFLTKVLQNLSPNFRTARSNQNQWCVLVWGSFSGCRCSGVLELHRALIVSSAAQAYGNARPQTC
jgi:hypothetical protein